jgi:hypothetical protein
VERRFNFSNFTVLKWMNWWINIEPVMFERFLAGIFQPEEVRFRLRAVKPG